MAEAVFSVPDDVTSLSVYVKTTLGGYEFYPLYAMDLSTVYYK